MEPVFLDQKAKKGFIVFHKCTKCGKMISNKVSDDDNQEKLIELASKPKPQNA